ncbi:phosphatase and actin regulator 4B isoform X2 [Mobula hypostoma]|uniref:phosphatase and actin regulator 4B isoform X2 n=1 Tax=Mobula hypostoma TaxID=723540 RepID=UPI002FC36A25
MGQSPVSSAPQSASGDAPPTVCPDSPPTVPVTPPLRRKSKLASISNLFKPWKWRRKRTSPKFQETSALLERKMSARQSREELVRRGVLKEVPDPAGSSEVTVTNGHSVHTIPIKVQPTEGGLLDASSTDTGLSQRMEMSEQGPPGEAGPPQGETPALLLSGRPDCTPVGATDDDDLDKMNALPVLSKPTKRNTNVEHTPSPSENLSCSTSAPLSPPSLQPVLNTKFLLSTSDIPGTGDAHTKSPRQSEPSSQPSPVLPRQSGPSPDSPPPTDLLDDSAEAQRPQAVSGQDVTRSDPEKEADTTPTGSTLYPQHSAANEKMDAPDGQTGLEEDLKSRAVESGCCDVAGEEAEGVKERGRVRLSPEMPVVVIPSWNVPEPLVSDSDSDPVQYRNDSDEEDDEESLNSALAIKIRRRDTLASKLRQRPSKQELEEKNILPRTSSEEWTELRQQIGNKLIRRLSQRPSLEELEQRNILRYRNEEEEQEERLEIRRRLTRKLSLRPTVAELQARRILRFNEYVEVTEAQDYDRRADKPWTRLTPADKAAIRKELNEFKSREMEVHEESRHLTRFHRP